MSEQPILSKAEARKRYLLYVGVRFFGLAVMVLGVWLSRTVGQAPGLAVVLLGGATLFIRPKHLGLTRR
ncbi:hypothetical protein [Sandarakinorhabdus rubra]|uniref:hypothetical protein n=1 Tax=Sandarakinorhabdus rubra TaxID=2672568 RepID=UPI0013DBA68C|nr:hypothetical protein [Sandarakinorhabdus rubra]